MARLLHFPWVMHQDNTTARPRPAWLSASASAELELPDALEDTREVVLGTKRTSGFYQSPTQKESLEEGTVKVALVRSRPRLLRGDQLTGPPEPLFLAPGREATRPRLPMPGPHVGEGELTTVRAFPREVEVIAPPGLMRRAAAGRQRQTDLSLTGPPSPMNRIVEPRPSTAPVRPMAVPTRATNRPPRSARPATRQAAPHRPGELPAPGRAAADSFSRICWNVLMAPPEESPRGLLARIPWRKHRAQMAVGAGALGAAVILVLLLVLSGAQEGGRVEVISSPPGARVTVNGKQTRQTTPALIKVTDVDREQVVELSLPDYRGWRKVVTLSPGDPRVQVVAVLQFIEQEGPTTESLAVSATP